MDWTEVNRRLFLDRYEIAMAAAYVREGRADTTACFDYFFRNPPFDGGYTVFAGLGDFIAGLEAFRFGPEELAFLEKEGFSSDLLDLLGQFRFRGDIHAAAEGEPVFPHEPVVRVEGGLLETQLLETLLLNRLNFQSLIATKAARLVHAARGAAISEFGLRRAQGEGGLQASRSAFIGGCTTTSNLEAAHRYGIPAIGTMAHSYVLSHDNELDAFRAFARSHPDDSVFVLDTRHTLESGLPNAITVAREMEGEVLALRGVRLDSGDLAYLARECRRRLDEAGLPAVRIIASNQLDESVIRSLVEQGAPIDTFGVGTALAIGRPDAALDGVYKLALVGDRPVMKTSDSLPKTTLPGRKATTRYSDDEGNFVADAIHLEDEPPPDRILHPHEPGRSYSLASLHREPLLKPVLRQGRAVAPLPSAAEAANHARTQLKRLPAEHRRFENPHTYKVGLGPELAALRDRLSRSPRPQNA